MRKLVLALIFVLIFGSTALANDIHKIQDAVEIDKWAHLGVGYIISGELEKRTKLTRFERFLVVMGLAYAKEQWVDKRFDEGDFWATCIGGGIQITW